MNRWFIFCILTFTGGVAYKVSSMKDMFYVPMMEFWNLSNAQIGGLLSFYGMVASSGLIFGVYLNDIFSKKYMIGGSLLGISAVGLYLSTMPESYTMILIGFGIMAIFGEITYWPVLLKAIRLLGDEKTQGRMFGFLEVGRGFVDVIVASSALALFNAAGQGIGAFRIGILFLTGVTALAGILTLIFVPNDPKRANEDGKPANRAKVAFDGMKQVLKNVDVWAVGINGFFAYAIYCGLTFFMPFLNEIYLLPAVAIGVFGILNQYGLKIIGGTVGGLLTDKVFKSPSKYMRFAYIFFAVAMAAFMVMPHETLGQGGHWVMAAILTMAIGSIVFTMRSVFFAPMEEIKAPKETSGASMSLASLLVYLPESFTYLVYGLLLDKFPGMTGYKVVWGVMIVLSIMGVGASTFLIQRVKKHQNEELEA